MINMFDDFKAINPKKILVIRSSANLFPIVIEELQKTFSETDIDVLVTKGTNISNWSSKVRGVIELSEEGGFQWRYVRDIKDKLRQASYDMVIVLYNSIKGYGYLNIDAFALAAKAKDVISVNLKKEVARLTMLHFCFKALYRIINCVWYAINVVLLFCVIISMFLGMLITTPVIAFNKMRKS